MKALDNRRLALKLCVLLLPWLVGGCSSLSPADALNAIIPATGYTLTADIDYGSDAQQKLDIYLPEEPASVTRTIVFVYGGAWRKGSRKDFEFVGQTLADAGHIAVIPDYRHYPSVVFPEFITDVAMAVEELDSRSEELLGFELEEIVLMGHSAGAHTAALLTTDEDYLSGVDADTIALIAIAGPYDLPLDDPEVQPLFRNAESATAVNPVMLVTEAHPPTLLIHGDRDKRVLPKHTFRYAEALETAGVDVQVDYLEDTGHVGSITGLAAPFDAKNRYQERLTDFLDQL